MRRDGRRIDEIRAVTITANAQPFAEGSAMIHMGGTKVLCTVSEEDFVPGFLHHSGNGWITAEYAMLPRSTQVRNPREGRKNGPRGRTQEIQRLIGRSLRAVVDLHRLGERTLVVDCDVIQADGGTRTAAITGGYVALYQALSTLLAQGKIDEIPIKYAVGAISVGLIDSGLLLDLCYDEDHEANADFNVVMTDNEELIEIQGTAEQRPFSKRDLDSVLEIARLGISQLFEVQKTAITQITL